MDQVTVTFDGVFDIVRHSQRNRVPCTEFGFQAGGTKRYGIAVPGSPEIAPGITITAVLQKPGDWQSLLGWVNHKSGEIACRSLVSDASGAAAFLVASVWAFHLQSSNGIGAACALLVGLGLLGCSIVGARRTLFARKLLSDKKAALIELGQLAV